MSLLQEEQGVIELLFLNVDQRAFIQLQQNEGDFVFGNFEFFIVMLVE